MSSISEFTSLGLAPALLRAIAESGYETPTPIQSQAIPVVLSGRDLLAAAQTGTGKTAAFTLPILQLLSQTKAPVARPGRPRVLILTPTRELAAQVEESVQTYGKHVPLKSMVIFGGVNINPQFRTLRGGIDLLVATPGRLLDHVGQRTVDLSGVEILVLDEADRMLDMGFIRDIRKILALLPGKRQNLLFSATFSEEIRQLASGLLRNPATVEVAPRNAAAELVRQVAHIVPRDRKRALLTHLIASQRWTQVLVFTKTKHGANRLAEQLGKDGINAMAIHGNKSQGARTRALAEFKDGTLPVLVATDIAARGLDIDQLPHVVNYELPHVAEDYVHRIGRTGRAGSEGDAVSLVDGEELKLLAGIERLIKRPIERVEVAGYTGLQHGSRPVAEFDRDDAPAPGGNRRSRPGPRTGNAGNAGKRPPNGGNRSAQPASGGNRSAQPASGGNRSAQPGGSRPASRPTSRPAGDFGSRSFGRVR